MITCMHKSKEDLTQGLGAERHFYCHDCGMHWYAGKIWTKKEWAEWIEIIDNG